MITMHHKILNVYFSLSYLTPKAPYVFYYAHTQSIISYLTEGSKYSEELPLTCTTLRTFSSIYLFMYDLYYSLLVQKSTPQACLNSYIPRVHRSYLLSSKQEPLSNNSSLFPLHHNISSLLDHSHTHTLLFPDWKVPSLTPFTQLATIPFVAKIFKKSYENPISKLPLQFTLKHTLIKLPSLLSSETVLSITTRLLNPMVNFQFSS